MRIIKKNFQKNHLLFSFFIKKISKSILYTNALSIRSQNSLIIKIYNYDI